MIHTKGTYMIVLRGFCDKIISASALANGAVSQRRRLPSISISTLPSLGVFIGESHDSPDAGVCSVGSLVGALVLGHLVLGVDETAV